MMSGKVFALSHSFKLHRRCCRGGRIELSEHVHLVINHSREFCLCITEEKRGQGVQSCPDSETGPIQTWMCHRLWNPLCAMPSCRGYIIFFTLWTKLNIIQTTNWNEFFWRLIEQWNFVFTFWNISNVIWKKLRWGGRNLDFRRWICRPMHAEEWVSDNRKKTRRWQIVLNKIIRIRY